MKAHNLSKRGKGYIKIANTRNLEERLFYNENIN